MEAKPVFLAPQATTAQVTPVPLSPAPPTPTVQVTHRTLTCVRMELTPLTLRQDWNSPPIARLVLQVSTYDQIWETFSLLRHMIQTPEI